MKFYISNNIVIEHPTTELINWCKANLKLSNPEYTKKARMGFWIGNTAKTLYLYETIGDNLILPYGVIDLIPTELLSESKIIYNFPNNKAINYNADIPLRDYQEKAVNNMLIAGHGILQAPAGSGKTRCGISLFTKWKARTLWLCHTKDLINQAKKATEQFIDKSLIGTITEGKVNIGKGVTFATIQTMSRINLTQYKNLWDCIIVDECHRISGSPTKITQYQKVLNGLSAKHKYGLSATVHRSDGLEMCMFSLIGKVAYKVSEKAVTDKIMQIGICSIPTETQLNLKMLNTDGTLNYAKLINCLTTNDARNDKIHHTLCNHRQYSSLILSERLAQLRTMIAVLPPTMKEKAILISGNMTTKKGKAEREQAIDDMRTGRKKYLFATYQLAKEGLDIPCLERLYMASPVKDYAVVTQAIGRTARTYEGKSEPICYDFVDDIEYCIKAYKQRIRTYKKNNCYFVKE